MKALTLNIHSHFKGYDREQYHHTITRFAEYVIREQVDVIAIQESSQTRAAKKVPEERLGSFVPGHENTDIKEDNCTYLICQKLHELGAEYQWTWCYAKIGYDIYEEGLSIISRYPILDAEEFYISRAQDVHNWRSRKITGAKLLIDGSAQWFYSVHMGWWDDEEEAFLPQMQKLHQILSAKKGNIFLMGDFNSPSDREGEGYDHVKSLGWLDTFELAEKKDDGNTVLEEIDGWKGKNTKEMRIDYIWSKEKILVNESRVVFSGKNEEILSDHFGVIISAEG